MKTTFKENIISILCFLLGILIVTFSTIFSGAINPHEIKIAQGKFIKYYEASPTSRYIRLDNGTKYEIDSTTGRNFKKDMFLKEVKPNSTLKLLYYKDTNIYSEVSYSVLSVNMGNKNFMDFNKSQKSRQINQKIGIILGSVFIISSLFLLIFSKKLDLW